MPRTEMNKGKFGVHKRPKGGGKRPNNPKPVPMNPAQPEGDPAYINPEALTITKRGSYAAGILAALSAVPVFLEATDFASLPDSAIYGGFALAGLCVIAVTVLIRTDLQVRGAAKISVVENLYAPSEAKQEADEEVPEENEMVYDAPAATVPIAEHITVKLHDGNGRLVVLAVGWNPETGTLAYLVGKPGEKPRWVDDDEVQTADYKDKVAGNSEVTTRH